MRLRAWGFKPSVLASLRSGGLALALIALGALPAGAQDKGAQAKPATPPPLNYAPAPAAAVPTTTAPRDAETRRRNTLTLKAMVTEDGPAITSGLVWRIFRESPTRLNSEERLQHVATGVGGECEFLLDPGSYLVHASYGRAAATTRIDMNGRMRSETMILNAGGLKLTALLSGDKPLSDDLVSFDIYSLDMDQRGDRQALVLGAKPGKVVRLNADTYRVVSHYGDVNAISRAEVHVNPGKMTEAIMYHKAAKLTFKLVAAPGGEAIANVNWSITSKSGTGDSLTKFVGAFPQTVLAVGDYTVTARQGDQVFTRDFKVESGKDSEIEVVAK